MSEKGTEEQLSELPPSAKLVYKVLEYNGRLSQKRLVEETRLSSRTLRYALSELEDADLVASRSALHDARQTCYTIDRDRAGSTYARNALVDPEWVHDRLSTFEDDDSDQTLLYVGMDGTADTLIPGSVVLESESNLLDPNRQRIPDRRELEELLGGHGITEDTQLVVYDGGTGLYAAYMYWILAYYGHRDQRLLDGSLDYWLGEGYPTTDDPVSSSPIEYTARGEFDYVRAHRDDVVRALSHDTILLDVRTPSEHHGESARGSDLTAATYNKGHIPGAINIPWDEVLDDDGRFAPREDLEALFVENDITSEWKVIVYCGVGARSALVWFTLSELLGYPEVLNYDGSWTEWGNLVDAPVETE